MSPTIGMFTTPRVIQSVVSTMSGPDPRKYVLVSLAGATSAGSLRSVMTLTSAEACFQPDIATYLGSFYIVSVNCATSLAVTDVNNTSLYPLVGAQNIFFVFIRVLFAGPDLFRGSFPFFAILHTLEFIGVILMEHYPCSSTLLFNGM